ncbi:MAG: primosomal protein DnaI [Bacilli bacterium]|nr:primosomal protein DnaI [Bacilli bacterium]
MEKLKSVVSINKLESSQLMKEYMNACSSKEFKTYIESLNIEETLLVKYTSSIQDALLERKQCEKCQSFRECTHAVKGYCMVPEKVGKRVVFIYVPCEKYKKYNELNKNVTYFEVSREIKAASFQELYKDDKARIPIIKYFKEFIDHYLENNRYKGLYLTGNFGVGKTYLISALFNELSKRGVKSTIVYYPEFLRNLKSSFKDDYEEKFNFVKKSPLLLLDDIGAENCSGWNRDEVLAPILQYRMEEALPTFFTSNFNLKELETHLASTSNGIEKVKARRLIERVKQLSTDLSLISENRRD